VTSSAYSPSHAAAPSSPGDGAAGGVAEEVREVFARYEQALREADVAVLTELFWDDPRCVRYGIADRQHGAAEIAAWRREHPGVPAGRTLRDTVVLALGSDAAVVSTLFGYPGRAAEGRQTQTWARTADGWRIVAAHVSEVDFT
jgi:ketosteroid isomerase-like protein